MDTAHQIHIIWNCLYLIQIWTFKNSNPPKFTWMFGGVRKKMLRYTSCQFQIPFSVWIFCTFNFIMKITQRESTSVFKLNTHGYDSFTVPFLHFSFSNSGARIPGLKKKIGRNVCSSSSVIQLFENSQNPSHFMQF